MELLASLLRAASAVLREAGAPASGGPSGVQLPPQVRSETLGSSKAGAPSERHMITKASRIAAQQSNTMADASEQAA